MAYRIRRLDYYHTQVTDVPGAAYELLSSLASLGVNLLAFTAVPVGPEDTQLTLFPEDPHRLQVAAQKAGMRLTGPHPALLVQGDDEMGALAKIHARLAEAKVNVYASTCVTDGAGRYGYVIYVRPEQYERAQQALEV
jgi:hypothetical protein